MLPEKLYGINTVSSLLEVNAGNRKIYEILINSQKKDSLRIIEIIKKAASKKIPIKIVEPEVFSGFFTKDPSFKPHEEDIRNTQGVFVAVSSYNYPELETDLKKISESIKNKDFKKNIVFVLLDCITDEGNFGAILRNCSAFGVDGVIIPSNRSVGVSRKVSRISSGALEEIKVYKVKNLVRTINNLKENGFWIYGTTLSENSNVISAIKADYSFPAAIIFGNEEKGMGKLVEENCDVLIKIEIYGRMQSLNVAGSAGITLYIMRNYKR